MGVHELEREVAFCCENHFTLSARIGEQVREVLGLHMVSCAGTVLMGKLFTK